MDGGIGELDRVLVPGWSMKMYSALIAASNQFLRIEGEMAHASRCLHLSFVLRVSDFSMIISRFRFRRIFSLHSLCKNFDRL